MQGALYHAYLMKTGERMNVHPVYSALPLDERSQCIMKSSGSLPGSVRETGLSS